MQSGGIPDNDSRFADNPLELDYAVACSRGVVRHDVGKHEDLDALLAEGDALMYQRKRGGAQR